MGMACSIPEVGLYWRAPLSGVPMLLLEIPVLWCPAVTVSSCQQDLVWPVTSES